MITRFVKEEKTGNILGCIVGISPENVGFAIANPRERINKKFLRIVAVGRACVNNTIENWKELCGMFNTQKIDEDPYYRIACVLDMFNQVAHTVKDRQE